MDHPGSDPIAAPAARAFPSRPVTARIRPGRDVRIVSLTAGGALVEGDFRLAPGARVTVQFGLPGTTPPVGARIVESVVHTLDPTRGTVYRSSLEFDSPITLPGT